MKKFRGGVQVKTQKSYSSSSFGTWSIQDSSIIVKVSFHTVTILKDKIIEIRCRRRPCPEFTVVYYTEDQNVNISSLGVLRQKTKDAIKAELISQQYKIQEETRWSPKNQETYDELRFDLMSDSGVDFDN